LGIDKIKTRRAMAVQ